MRLKYALVRTTFAVFNTSFTTAAAFFATAVSPIMPISSFGVFSAVVIVTNYVFVLTLTPSALLINEYARMPRRTCCCDTVCGCCCYEGFCLNFFCKSKCAPAAASPELESGSTESQVQAKPQGFFRGFLLPSYKKAVATKPVAISMVPYHHLCIAALETVATDNCSSPRAVHHFCCMVSIGVFFDCLLDTLVLLGESTRATARPRGVATRTAHARGEPCA